MIVYIAAEYPFVLKQDGRTIKNNDDGLYSAILNECGLLEVCPLIPALPRYVTYDYCTSEISDPTAVKADLGGGVFVKFKNTPTAAPFALVSQKRFNNALITVYRETGLKISVETRNDFALFVADGDEAETGEINVGGKSFLYAECGKRLMIFDTNEKITRVFDGATDGWKCENGAIATTTDYRDMAKHKLTARLTFDGTAFTASGSELIKDERFTPSKLPHRLLPFAFAEAVIAGDDLTPYLAENLTDKTDALRSYFGGAKGVFPSPPFKNSHRPAVVYKRAENVYFCRYLECEFKGRLITNIKLSDF